MPKPTTLGALHQLIRMEWTTHLRSLNPLHNVVEVPNDFIELAVKAMIHLKENHRSNVLYNLVKGLGVMRQDKSDTRFPMIVMPMGLLEYMVNFYNAEEMRKVSGNVPCTLLLH